MVNRCASMMGAEGGGWCLREEGRKNWSRLASVSSSSSSSSSFVEAPADGKRLPWGKKEGRKSSYFSFDDLLVLFLQVVRSTHTHTLNRKMEGEKRKLVSDGIDENEIEKGCFIKTCQPHSFLP